MHYVGGSVQEHFERRASLYRSLGLSALAFRNARVLEVAVGSGQNSLYVASLMPESLTLIEPNPTGIGEIQKLYAKSEVRHVAPTLVESTLQDYVPAQLFDIVICENWLGRAEHERAMLRKLTGMLDQQGIVVVTTVTPTGFLPNLVRRALAIKYCDPRLPFQERSNALENMFAPHLKTISAMTRSARDWVQDNMINPAYFDLCLTIPDVIRELDGMATALGTNPVFSSDWRWFKELKGTTRAFNSHLIQEYESALHNFFDYQKVFLQPDVQLNRELGEGCLSFLETVRAYEFAAIANAGESEKLQEAIASLTTIVNQIRHFPDSVRTGLEAGLELLRANYADRSAVAAHSPFSRLFGRETVYLSLIADVPRNP